LILLSKVDRLDLLGVGGVDVFAPRAVLDEVRAHPAPDSNLERALRAGQICEIATPEIPRIIQAWDLGAGESSVLAVAYADRGAEAVLDDGDARRCAQALGVTVRGSLGIVLLAKRVGEIPAARPLIDQLRRVGLYLTDDLANQALALVGE
jgi:predicted nucleic acid-binding protein